MDTDLIEQIRQMLTVDTRQKDRIAELARTHREWDPILRHDMIHHAMLQDAIPQRLDDESDFDYKTRLLALRRRLDAQTRLAGCLLHVLEEQM